MKKLFLAVTFCTLFLICSCGTHVPMYYELWIVRKIPETDKNDTIRVTTDNRSSIKTNDSVTLGIAEWSGSSSILHWVIVGDTSFHPFLGPNYTVLHVVNRGKVISNNTDAEMPEFRLPK